MALSTFSIDLDVGGGTLLQVDSAGDVLAVSVATGVFMPAPWTAKCTLFDPGADIIPPMGGQAQRFGRLGARWAVTFSTLPALAAAAARGIQALRAKARADGQTMLFLWPQPAAAALTAIGGPVVNGGGQLGTSLAVSGLTAGAVIPAMTFFNFSAAGRNYLHAVTASATANGSGLATLSIAPMMRASPAAGAMLNFATPAIEGFIDGKSEDFLLTSQAWVGMPSFSVMEAM